jgi:hypothetical protein
LNRRQTFGTGSSGEDAEYQAEKDQRAQHNRPQYVTITLASTE